jgi:hypothetical protein
MKKSVERKLLACAEKGRCKLSFEQLVKIAGSKQQLAENLYMLERQGLVLYACSRNSDGYSMSPSYILTEKGYNRLYELKKYGLIGRILALVTSALAFLGATVCLVFQRKIEVILTRLLDSL